MKGNSLIISDTQEPFGALGAIRFCKAVQKEFNVPDENIFHAGDEADLYNFSAHPKSPDAMHNARTELKALRLRIREWAKAFPKQKIAESNHMFRIVRRAFDAQLPSDVLRSYREIIDAPEDWHWKPEWIVKDAKAPWRLIHGMGYSGRNGHRNAAIDAGISTVIGHLSSFGGAEHIRTAHKKIWALNVGCLIDVEAYAFEYGRFHRVKPTLGCGVVIDGGITPIFLPFEKL